MYQHPWSHLDINNSMEKAKFNTAWAHFAVGILLCAITTGCVMSTPPCLVPEEQQANAVGVFKSSFFDPGEWHHTATIHGWGDDLEACIDIVESLNQEEPGRYKCQSLK